MAQQILRAVDPGLPVPAITPIYSAGLNGRYISDELPVVYELAAQGSKLSVTITGASGQRIMAEPLIISRSRRILSEQEPMDNSRLRLERKWLRDINHAGSGVHVRRAD